MSVYDVERRKEIFKKTNGRCHLCGRRIALRNYGNQDSRGAWEVDHSVPRAEGGTDRLNNLLPAHISCNRYTRLKRAAGGALAGAALGARFGGPVGLWLGLLGGIVGYALDPES